MFVQTLFVHISHANTTSPNAQIPFYWTTLTAYFSPRHLTQVGRNENAYLELQNATRFNRLRNLTSNFSNTKVRIVHLKAISLGYYRSQNYAFCNALLLRKMILETIFGSQVNLDLKFRNYIEFPWKTTTQPFHFLDILHISLERTPRVFPASLEPAFFCCCCLFWTLRGGHLVKTDT